jgi:hypothetical protein
MRLFRRMDPYAEGGGYVSGFDRRGEPIFIPRSERGAVGAMGVPSSTDLNKYSVNRPGWEAVRQSFYDFQAYAAAGQTTLIFFQVPAGQSSKTASDTNTTNAGLFPANQQYLVESIEVHFFPTVPSVTAQNPAAFGAGAIAQIVNDVYVVGRTGNGVLFIGSKPYLTEAPIGRFPPKTHFNINAALADATTAGAAQQSRIAYAYWSGRPYLLSPTKLLLIPTQNFSFSLNWPEGAQALPSGNPGRIGVILDGILYRKSQ